MKVRKAPIEIKVIAATVIASTHSRNIGGKNSRRKPIGAVNHKYVEFQLIQCQSPSRMRGQPGQLEFSVRSGAIQIAWNDEGLLTRVQIFSAGGQGSLDDSPWVPKRAIRLIENMVDYFDRGSPLDQISWEDLAISEWSEFQKKVYQATSLIPHGETRTYGWVAHKIGKTLACRAVGQALSKNPVPLLVPCHRVVSNHSLGGFMGEDDPDAPVVGLKRQLLDLEHDFKNPAFSFFGSAAQA